MKEAKEKFETIQDDVREYIEMKSRYYYLKFIDKVSGLVAQGGLFVTLLLASFIFIILLSIAIAFLLNDLLKSVYVGFFIVSGIYLLFIFVLLWRKKQIELLIINSIVKGLLTDSEEDYEKKDTEKNEEKAHK